MVGDFLRKAKDIKDILTGSNDGQVDGDADYGDRQVSPASEDPYGDPADQYGNAIPASQDPYGDPADQYGGDVRPASEDPYGDPADEYNR
ncbi:translation initiation factor [Scytonema hofmannii FACHB-248]|uniref:Translation initiation factor n=1 Tax=Scytonema hofmannii FACHB-248 TaxID=1842502 RepID=A0ABR8H0Z8_9CYAN|nr:MULTISPECIES: hypothetical protein [Nostocales]MBD2609491.1 translation initiation factor [Scytonema hofmannii FACHB-248]